MFRSLESGKAKERSPFDEEDFLKDDIWERRDVLGTMLDARGTKDPYDNFFSIDQLGGEFSNQSHYTIGLNHELYISDSNSIYEDEYSQQGRKVSKESLGIKKSDSSEAMMGKLMKGMKPGDYIDDDDLDFLNSKIGLILDKATMTSSGVLQLDRTFAGRMAGVGTDAKLIIKPRILNGMNGYDFKLTGVSSTKIYTSGFVNDNKLYFYEKGKLFSTPIK